MGRRLRSGEVVHHTNHNKRDNSEENLYICSSQREHEKIHRLDIILGKGIGIELINKRTCFDIEIIQLIIKAFIVVIVVYFLLEFLGVI